MYWPHRHSMVLANFERVKENQSMWLSRGVDPRGGGGGGVHPPNKINTGVANTSTHLPPPPPIFDNLRKFTTCTAKR